MHTWLVKVIVKANTLNLGSTRGTFISSRKNWNIKKHKDK